MSRKALTFIFHLNQQQEVNITHLASVWYYQSGSGFIMTKSITQTSHQSEATLL